MSNELKPTEGYNRFNTSEVNLAIERIAQLESEIETRRAEISRLKAAANGVAINDAEEVPRDESKDPLGYPENIRKFLGEIEDQCLVLNSLWEQRLADSTCRSNSMTDGDENTLPTTISTSPGNDIISVASNDTASHTPPPRRTNAFVEHSRTILSMSFGSARSKKTKPNDLERMVQERDLKIEELEAVIYSNIEVIYKMRDTIKLIGEGETAGHKSAENIAQLKEALTNRIDEESLALSLGKGDQIMTASKINIEGEAIDLREVISALRNEIKDSESTIKLQKAQVDMLKKELVRLQKIINDMESRSSSQEDEIENMRAEMIKLEFKYDEKRMMEEDLSIKLGCRDETISNLESAFEKKAKKMIDDATTFSSLQELTSVQEDQIEMLKAQIMKLKFRSDLREEEERHEMKEMATNMELSQIECSTHDIS